MTAEEIQAMIAAGLDCERVDVDGDGHHWYALIVSTAFEGKRSIARHQMVYATLSNKLHSNELHALSMRTFTPAEWAEQG